MPETLYAGAEPPPRPPTWRERFRAHYGSPALKASDVVEPFAVTEGDRVMILARVSSHQQAKRLNLQGQCVGLRARVERRGGVVAGVEAHEWSGRDPAWIAELSRVRDRTLSRNASTLLAACADRIVRHPGFRSADAALCRLQATGSQWRDVAAALKGIRLMTYLRPDAPPAECRSLLTRWGMRVRRTLGLSDAEFREEWLPTAVTLRGRGHSHHDIAGIILGRSGRRVTGHTVGNWLSTDYTTSEKRRVVTHAPEAENA